jgi:hypothetical protein
MSYLQFPRIVFSGRYQADVSTVNNEVRHYDNATWQERFRAPQDSQDLNGWWNPEGSGAFRIIGGKVTSVEAGEQAGAVDKSVGLTVTSNIDCAPAKLVDLDPQFQFASMIWGLQLVLTDGAAEYLRADYAPAPFRDLFFGRIGRRPGSGNASAKFTSVLENIIWGEGASQSPVLSALKEIADEAGGRLSVSLTTIGYDSNSASNTFTLGLLVGAIGPWREGEPRFFPAGRRFAPTDAPQLGGSARYNLNFLDAWVGDGRVTVDLSNAIALDNRAGKVTDQGPLTLALLREEDRVEGSGPDTTLQVGVAQNAVVTADQYIALGEIPYRDEGWLLRTAGIASFALPDTLDVPVDGRPLAILAQSQAGTVVALRETVGGWFVRADNFEQRVDAASAPQRLGVDLHTLRFGRPFDDGQLRVTLDARASGGGTGGPEPHPPAAPVPDINFPAAAIGLEDGGKYAPQKGRAEVRMTASDPGRPREYVDGQIFTLTYAFEAKGVSTMPPLDGIVLHVREAFVPLASPQWSQVEPVLTQFANLYPIMSRRLFDFSDMSTAAEKAKILRFALTRPLEDPNHMPVTRDLSEGKRAMLISWLDKFTEPPVPAEETGAAEAFAQARVEEAVAAYPLAPVAANPQLGRLLALQRLKGMSTERAEEELAAHRAARAADRPPEEA